MLRSQCRIQLWTRRTWTPLLQWQSRTRPSGTRLYSPYYPPEGVFQQNTPPGGPPPQQQQSSQGYSEAQQPLDPAPTYGRYPSPYQSSLRPQRPSVRQSYNTPAYSQQPPASQPTRRGLRIGSVLSILVCLGIGYVGAQSITLFSPLLPSTPGSEEDQEELAFLGEDLAALPLVQELRSQRTIHPLTGLPNAPVWREWVAYSGLKDPARRAERMTTGPLSGSAGLAAQVVFWNEARHELILFVAFGPGTTGWPNVVHGGALATICDEALGRVAIRSTEKQTGVTATLGVKYLDKCAPGQWYVFHAGLDKSKESSDRKFWVKGYMSCVNEVGPELKDLKLGMGAGGTDKVHVHLTAEGLFVVPKQVELKPILEDF